MTQPSEEHKKRPHEDKDKLILDLFASDPKAAFRLLFDTYHMPLCIYAFQLSDSFTLAEDIVQEFLIYFWEKKSYNNISTNLRSYLYLSIRNATYLHLKKNKLISIEELSDNEFNITDEFYDEDELHQLEKELMQQLEKLPPQELAAVKAVVLENRKYKEAALELNISVNTLKTHLSRAFKELRKQKKLIYILIICYHTPFNS